MKMKYFLRGMGVGIVITVMLFSVALIFNPPSLTEEEIRTEAVKLGMVDEQSVATEASTLKTDTEEKSTDKNTDKNKDKDKTKTSEDTKKKSDSDSDKNKDDKKSSDTKTDSMGVASLENNSSVSSDTGSASDSSKKSDSSSKSSSTSSGSSSSSTKNSSTKSSSSSGSSSSSSSEKKTTETKKPSESEEISFSITSGESSREVVQELVSSGVIDSAEKFDSFLVENDYDNYIETGDYTVKRGASYEEIAETITKK